MFGGSTFNQAAYLRKKQLGYQAKGELASASLVARLFLLVARLSFFRDFPRLLFWLRSCFGIIFSVFILSWIFWRFVFRLCFLKRFWSEVAGPTLFISDSKNSAAFRSSWRAAQTAQSRSMARVLEIRPTAKSNLTRSKAAAVIYHKISYGATNNCH